MSDSKRNSKSKDINESEMLDDSQFVKSVSKKRTQKRQKPDANEEDISSWINLYQAGGNKKKKVSTQVEEALDSKNIQQKLLEVMIEQQLSRKRLSEKFMKELLDVISQIEANQEVLEANERKLEHLADILIKCIKETSSAQKQNLHVLKKIQAMYQKGVEGLLTRGGMRPDDRPVWFDVYRAFPPLSEPKFAKPKPEIKPIRQILYQEDIIRAKFHSKGHGYGAVNMLNPAGDTHTRKLVKQYEKLKSEGIPENELIEKAVSAIGTDRPVETPKLQRPPGSVTSQVLEDANLKNIFKD